MSFSEHNFKNCFGDLSQTEQDNLRKTLFNITNIINKELETKPFINDYGEVNFIKLENLT